MGDPLAFLKLGLAVLQVAGNQLQGFVCAFAIFDVGECPVPPDNFPVLIAKWDATYQEPPIFFVVGATEARLVFERLSGCNRDGPLLRMAHKIFRMDCALPTCA